MNISSQAFSEFKGIVESSPLGLLYIPKELAQQIVYEFEHPAEVLDPEIAALEHSLQSATQYLILRKLALADRRMVSIEELRHASFEPMAYQTVLCMVCELRLALKALLPQRKILSVGSGYCLV